MVDQRRIDDQRFVDAETAARHLGIQLRTLYAYVSRGKVRSLPGEHGRPRLYALADLERLRVRRDARAGHGAVAAGALRWGEPVLDSAITAITARGPVYRGHLAVELAAAGVRFEAVAELLWTGYLPQSPVAWPRMAISLATLSRMLTTEPPPITAMSLLVPLAAIAAPARARDATAIMEHGRRLVPLLAVALAPGLAAATATRALGAGSIAAIAARALGLDDDAAPHLDHALVLLADHELNASSFAARIAASTDADPYACIAAALATVSGPRHGSASEEVAKFADEVGDAGAARAAVRALRKRGEVPPGFGHPLYPAGDPRATSLLELVRTLPPRKRTRTLLAIVDATADAKPSVDVALAALVAALGAPAAAGSGLFAVARSAGWLAHVLEQRAAGFLLRPRARYVGVPLVGIRPA
ncbi:MAG TPA: citrate/2-methylcitrate synthase [Kofleriaceae bacterium]|nr:citrate/2-methylcitrate synthase [Kofleriaceae bacterium]